MSLQQFHALMSDLIVGTGLAESIEEAGFHSLQTGDFEIIMALHPDEWVTFFTVLGEVPASPDGEYFQMMAQAAADFGTISPACMVGIKDGSVVQWMQHPLDGLSLAVMERLLAWFAESAQTNVLRFVACSAHEEASSCEPLPFGIRV